MLLLVLLYNSISRVDGRPLYSTTARTKTRRDVTPETVGWYSTPQVRGTFDLLLSCLTTLSLCAWTAYHPNVHGHRSNWKILSHRATWMLIAVLFPEVVLWCAWEQWWAAKKLGNEINALGEKAFDGVGTSKESHAECDVCDAVEGKEDDGTYYLDLLFEEDELPPPTPALAILSDQTAELKTFGTTDQSISLWIRVRKMFTLSRKSTAKGERPCNWTTAQAFFALSGGFAVPSSNFYPSPQLTLTSAALVFLARHGLLPRSSPTTVEDKSKADVIAKLLVCIQAGWFFIQCIARAAQKLPLTLLEVHVLAHVLCAFAMYAVWAAKPYDVGAPIMCEDEKVVGLAAFWALGVDKDFEREHSNKHYTLCTQNPRESPSGALGISHVRSAHRAAQMSLSTWSRYSRMVRNYVGSMHTSRPRSPKSDQRCKSLASIEATQREELHLQLANAGLTHLRNFHTHFNYVSRIKCHLTGSSRTNDSQAKGEQRADIQVPGPSSLDQIEEEDYDSQNEQLLVFSSCYIVAHRSNLIIDGIPKLTDDDNNGRTHHLMLKLKTYSIVTTCYGALHLLAWKFRFATIIEAWLWRGSGIVMVAAPIVTLGSFGPLSVATWAHVVHRSGVDSESRVKRLSARTLELTCDILWGAMFIAALVLWVLYPFARLYVLAESFASLRACEKTVYATVEWTNFWPHAG